MERPNKVLKQIPCTATLKTEEHKQIFMDKTIHEEILSQLPQTINKQFKIAVNFLCGYNGIFNKRSKNKKIPFTRSITDGELIKLALR